MNNNLSIPFSVHFRQLCRLLPASLLLLSFLASAQEFEWAPDYPVGTTLPHLEAPDQNGNIQTLDTLSAENGLLLVFNRSFDWCPYCKAQLQGLVDASDDFRDLGFGIATMTYDSEGTLKLAEDDFNVNFIMLRDVDRKHFEALGILNPDYSPGDFAYGIPLPGVMLVDPAGVIRVKLAEENYRIRPDWSDVLEAAADMKQQAE